MNELLSNLVEALREELKQYGELLAQLDHQQHLVIQRRAQDMMRCVAGINAQADTVQAVRREREQHQRHVAQYLQLGDTAPFVEILPRIPLHYGGLIQALVQENNELLIRVQQRARQNQLLLSHAVELMQKFINAILPGAAATPTYNDTGRLPAGQFAATSLYEAVG
ncbi:MAG: flagellar export chaperone FlgN [Verrucomicrobiota bacterium]